MKTRIIAALAFLASLFSLGIGAIGVSPASAGVYFGGVTVSIVDSPSGVLTTSNTLVRGQQLWLYGAPADGQAVPFGKVYTVTSVTPDGPVDRVTLGSPLPAGSRGNLVDFLVGPLAPPSIP